MAFDLVYESLKLQARREPLVQRRLQAVETLVAIRLGSRNLRDGG